MVKKIRSLQNAFIKDLILYKEKSRARKRSGLFLIEGVKEITLAIEGNYTITHILYNPEIASTDTLKLLSTSNAVYIEVSQDIYQRLAYRSKTEGVIAVANAKQHTLDSLKFKTKTPLILIAEAPEKPGNIGALLRTADAANVDAVIIANPKTDLYNPNIIRSSVGCLFTNHLATGTTSEIIHYLKQQHITIYCAALQASSVYYKQDFCKPTALVVGTEATGLSSDWLKASTQNIIIPMQGKIDSINVSVAAGIIIFEAIRQRQGNL